MKRIAIVSLACAGGIIATALFDYATGTQLDSLPLYAVICLWAGWYLGTLGAAVTAVLSGIVGGLAYYFAFRGNPEVAIVITNSFLRTLVFFMIGFVASRLQITSELQVSLRRQDPLTGMGNRRAFLERAQTELSRARRNPKPLILAHVEVAGIKKVNSTMGHAEGDKMLVAVARILGKHTRLTDCTARTGSAEFAILFTDIEPDDGVALLKRLHEALQVVVAEGKWPVRVSIGAAVFKEPPVSVEQMSQKASSLMYIVKEMDEDQVKVESFGL